MPRIRRAAAAALALPALALLLSGCAAPPDPVALEPGDCLAGEHDGLPLRDTVVDCAEPHLFEVVASLGAWPGAAEAVAAEEPRAVYERLVRADPDDALVAGLRAWAGPRCREAFDGITGAAGLAADGRPGPELGLAPAAPLWLTAAIEAGPRFAAGDHTVLCAVGWLDEEGALRAVDSPEGATLAGLLGPGLPLGLRECFDLDDEDARSPADCAEAHSGQVLAEVDAAAALGAGWVEDVDPSTGRAGDYDAADAVCAELVGALVPEGSLPDGLEAWADIDPREGWVGFDGTAVEGAHYPVSCSVLAPRGEALAGDALAGTATLAAG